MSNLTPDTRKALAMAFATAMLGAVASSLANWAIDALKAKVKGEAKE